MSEQQETEDGRLIMPHKHCSCGCGAHMGCFITNPWYDDPSFEEDLFMEEEYREVEYNDGN